MSLFTWSSGRKLPNALCFKRIGDFQLDFLSLNLCWKLRAKVAASTLSQTKHNEPQWFKQFYDKSKMWCFPCWLDLTQFCPSPRSLYPTKSKNLQNGLICFDSLEDFKPFWTIATIGCPSPCRNKMPKERPQNHDESRVTSEASDSFLPELARLTSFEGPDHDWVKRKHSCTSAKNSNWQLWHDVICDIFKFL